MLQSKLSTPDAYRQHRGPVAGVAMRQLCSFGIRANPRGLNVLQIAVAVAPLAASHSLRI
jgi:hypothetical protein